MVEREQNLRHATRQKLADNYTLSGGRIEAGLNIMGSPNLCHGCGREIAPYEEFCCQG